MRQEKKSKLANSNFSVNRTRLSVRNVSKGVGELKLKELFQNAVNKALEGKAHGAKGGRGGRSQGRLDPPPEGVGPVKVLGANLVRDKTKIDPETGKALTKGYGFVEFSEHAHALLAVRALNNCSETAKQHNLGRRLMIDFALDDARIVRQRRIKQVRVERAKQRRAAAAQEEAAAEGEEGEGKKLGRGALQRQKKRSRDAAGESAGGSKSKNGGKDLKKAGGSSKVRWGEASSQEGLHEKDLSKPYREKGNKMDGVVRAGTGRRTAIDPRGAAGAAKAAAKKKGQAAKTALRSSDTQLAELVSEVGDVMPKAKKAKRGNKDKPDDFDKLVKQYNSSLFKSDAGQGGRWFD